MRLAPSLGEGAPQRALLPERVYTLRTQATGHPQGSPRPVYSTELATGATTSHMSALPRWNEPSVHRPPVALLPPEILSLVFKICADAERPWAP